MENKELEKKNSAELNDDELNEVSGGFYALNCVCCGKAFQSTEKEVLNSCICPPCQLEQLRREYPNLSVEQLRMILQNNKNKLSDLNRDTPTTLPAKI